MIGLLDVAHREAQRLLATGAPVFLFVNPVEYHGPHLSLHNDRLISQGLARDVHALCARSHPDWPFLVGEDLELGVEPTPGPGTREHPFHVVRDAVVESCRALHALGARRVVAMTWHGAPMHSMAIEDGLIWLRAHGATALSPFNEAMRELCRLDSSRFASALAFIDDPRERAEVTETLRYDFHAGFFETSMSLHYAPSSVSPLHLDVAPCPRLVPNAAAMRLSRGARTAGATELADELAMIAHGLAWHALDPFPGYTGKPHLARAGAGAAFARPIVEAYATLVLDVIDRHAPAPPPPMRFLRALTVGGRIKSPVPAAVRAD